MESQCVRGTRAQTNVKKRCSTSIITSVDSNLPSHSLFALAHLIILYDLSSLATFFPGLILAWLFIKTRSLLAPILFHAFANIFYALITALIA